MEDIPHAAIYIHSDTDKSWLIKQLLSGRILGDELNLTQLTGEVYSSLTLQRFIEEELRHDHYEIRTVLNNTLANSSSGEQRKALLSYILSKEPGFIILDDVFESLDKVAREILVQKLNEISGHVLLIQLLNRRSDLLSFISSVYLLHGTLIAGRQYRTEFLSSSESQVTPKIKPTIPAPLHHYDIPPGPLVKLNNVSVNYNGWPILYNINWEINPGEFWQLTGPNGSGKSTLLSMITGDNPKAYGQDMVLFGKQKGSGETVWQIKEKVGYFSPNIARQFERQDTVSQMILSGLFDSVGLYLKPTDRQVNLVNQWLSLLQMSEARHEPFRLFPQGQQRMILIARAMIKHPPLLILDEPTSGLDDDAARLFTDLINQISAETNTAVLYVSHRAEPGLKPRRIFELFTGDGGSVGKATL